MGIVQGRPTAREEEERGGILVSSINEVMPLVGGHEGPVRHLVSGGFGDREVYLVTGGDDGRVLVWDAKEAVLVARLLPQNTVPVTSLRILGGESETQQAAASRVLVGLQDGRVHVYQLTRGFPECGAHETHTEAVCAAVGLPNGGYATASSENYVLLYDVAGKETGRIQLEADESIQDLICVHDKYLVISVHSSVLLVYDLAKLRYVVFLSGHPQPVCSLAQVSPTLFCSGSLDGTLYTWGADTLRARKYYNMSSVDEDPKFTGSIHRIVSVGDRMIAAAIGTGFKVYDCESMRCLAHLEHAHASQIVDLVSAYRGSRLITCDRQGGLRVWAASKRMLEAQNARPVDKNALLQQPTELAYCRELLQCMTASDIELLYTRSLTLSRAQLKENAVDALRPVLVGELPGHASSNAILALHAVTSTCVASASLDGSVLLWKDARFECERRAILASTHVRRISSPIAPMQCNPMHSSSGKASSRGHSSTSLSSIHLSEESLQTPSDEALAGPSSSSPSAEAPSSHRLPPSMVRSPGVLRRSRNTEHRLSQVSHPRRAPTTAGSVEEPIPAAQFLSAAEVASPLDRSKSFSSPSSPDSGEEDPLHAPSELHDSITRLLVRLRDRGKTSPASIRAELELLGHAPDLIDRVLLHLASASPSSTSSSSPLSPTFQRKRF